MSATQSTVAPAGGHSSTLPSTMAATTLETPAVLVNAAPPSFHSTAVSHDTNAELYLNLHFGTQKATLRSLVGNNKYGTAYRLALTERGIRSIAETMGMMWPFEGNVAPAVISSQLSISLADIVMWMGLGAASSFKNIRAIMAKSRVAWEKLNQWGRSGSSLNAEDAESLEILKTLVTADIIPFPDLSSEWNLSSGQFKAITMTKASWETLTASISQRSSST